MTDIKPFLAKVAVYFHESARVNPRDCCLVLPNRRAGLFLRKYLVEGRVDPFFAPSIFSIEDFISVVTDVEFADHLSLLSMLYDTHKICEGENSRPFDEFLGWAGTLIGDFNETDNQLADAKELFGFLNKAKAIALWNPGENKLSDFEMTYLAFYNSLATYYDHFTNVLKKKRLMYPGLAARILAETDEAGLVERILWKKILFAGFNALTAAEKKIVKTLVAMGKADILLDSDGYYLDDTSQEAGFFMRRNLGKDQFISVTAKENLLATMKREITVTGVAGRTGQAKAAGNILRDLIEQRADLTETALILNDESLLVPVLNSLPEEIGEFNVTMGLPLKFTPVFHFVTALVDMHQNALRYSEVYPGNRYRFYHQDMLRLISNVYSGDVLFDSGVMASALMEKIRGSNLIYLSLEDVQSLLGESGSKALPFISAVFSEWKVDAQYLPGKIREVISMVRSSYKEKGGEEETVGKVTSARLKVEYLYQFNLILNRMEAMPGLLGSIDTLRTFRSLLLQSASSANVPFYGEPLKGLQIMGMLETQALDFRNIIMLSVNDDLLPSGKHPNSFIPYDIRREFSLSTHLEKDAIFAYHFYRLLQRSEKVFLIYNTEPGLLGGGDPSRFVSQLLYEMPLKNPRIAIKEEVLALLPEMKKSGTPVTIPKSPFVVEKLGELAAKGFSATAFTTYINCPLQFCLRYVYGLDEEKDVSGSIDAPTLGTVIHQVLQKLYEPFTSKEITSGIIDKMKLELKPMLELEFNRQFREEGMSYGKNYLILRVAERMIGNFLDAENELIEKGEPLIIRLLEYRMSHNMKLKTAGLEMMITGICDRADELGGITRLIDYKTGFVNQRELKVSDWQDFREPGHEKAFQLLYYSYLYSRSYRWPETAGVISLRNQKSGLISLQLPEKNMDGETVAGIFEEILLDVAEEIFSEKPFLQTEDISVCDYCPFSGLCYK